MKKLNTLNIKGKEVGQEDVRNFDLGTVLTVTSGRLYTKMDNLYEILNFLSQDSLYTHQLPRVADQAAPYILEQYPQLKNVGVNEKVDGWKEVHKFIKEQQKIYGNSFALKPMPKEQCQHIDPLEEAAEIMSR